MSAVAQAAKTILVVDDDETVGTLFEMMLDRDGFRVDMANTGGLALQKIQAAAPGDYDLILLDLMMPGPDGFRVLEEIARTGHKCPVFIVTALTLDSGTIEEIRRTFATIEFWRKPFNAERFRKQLLEYLR